MVIIFKMFWGSDFLALMLTVWSGTERHVCTDASHGCCDPGTHVPKQEWSHAVPFVPKVVELSGRAVGGFSIVSCSSREFVVKMG